MSAEPALEEATAEDRSRYAGVLRFYDLAKHQEWQVKDVPWGEIARSPRGRAHRSGRRAGGTSGARS